jgi:photosystem II stability/assembly factor-like uncharacterized protein
MMLRKFAGPQVVVGALCFLFAGCAASMTMPFTGRSSTHRTALSDRGPTADAVLRQSLLPMAPTPAGYQWGTSATYRGPFVASSLACPTTGTCFVVGSSGAVGSVAKSSDAGRTWRAEDLPNATATLSTIACPSSRVCYASGSGVGGTASGIVGTTDGGATWVMLLSPSHAGSVQQLACPTARTCLAVGGNAILITRTMGRSWTSVSLPSGPSQPAYGGPITSVACPSASTCIGTSTDRAVVSHNGGRTWVGYADDLGGYYGTLACPTVNRCISVPREGGSSVTKDGGQTWQALNDNLFAISCPAVSYCVAVGELPSASSGSLTVRNGELLVSTDFGRSWRHLGIDVFFGALVCPAVAVCYATDGVFATSAVAAVMTTTSGWHRWSESALPAGVNELTSMTCASASVCTATTTGSLMISQDGGASWGGIMLPEPRTTVYSGVCMSAQHCVVIGRVDLGRGAVEVGPAAADVIWSTFNGGASWSKEVPPSPRYDPMALACPSSAICLAALGISTLPSTTQQVVVFGTNDGGASWSRRGTASVPVGNGAVPTELTCSSPMSCAIAGTNWVAMTGDGGSTWTTSDLPFRPDESVPIGTSALSCATSTTCMAVASAQLCPARSGCVQAEVETGAAAVTFDGGGTWTSISVPSGTDPNSVICTTASHCVAVGSEGVLTPSYSSSAVIYVPQPGVVLTTNNFGQSWNVEPIPSGIGQLNGITCPSSTWCIAAGSGIGDVGAVVMRTSS